MILKFEYGVLNSLTYRVTIELHLRQYRSWAKCVVVVVVVVVVFFGGGGNLAERNLGGSGKKIPKNFEILIPEIAANASNFKNYIWEYHLSILFLSPSLQNYWPLP